jgi:N-acetylglucosaminyldiphosphoundecaprenol N-acetyl-beta-D-mannosaminyltransferase
VPVLGIGVDQLHTADVLSAIDEFTNRSGPSVISYVNVQAMNIATHDETFRSFLRSSDLTILDGEGVRLGAAILGKRITPALGITRLIWDICEHCEKTNLSVYFLGSTEERIQKARLSIERRFPNLAIVGSHHGFFAKDGPESDLIVHEINKKHPDLLFVGFGMPIQEFWVARQVATLQCKVVMLVGGCFDFLAGAVRPAPGWIASLGLEWLFRLVQEPRRLWRRYLLGIPAFFARVISARCRQALRGTTISLV